jgi:predicted metalloprotease with PDZ domain
MSVRVRLHLRRAFVASAFVLVQLISSPASVAQQQGTNAAAPLRISYTLSMPEPETHLFEVRVDVAGVRGGAPIEFQMPRWSPGRYAIFDFAKNVQEARATNICPPGAMCKGREFAVRRLNTQTWAVDTDGAEGVSFRYKVFGDDLSGTFSQLDTRHASFNGASVFVYVNGHKQDPVSLRIEAPPGWKVVNGYTTRTGQAEFSFPNYDVLIDTPTDVAPDWTMDSFVVDGKTYRVVVHSLGDEGGKRAAFVRDVERVVREQLRMMGGAPDYEQYTFLIHFDPTATRSDGMEHLNSTQIVSVRALGDAGAYDGTLVTAAHEFFHVWNVKRLRPAGLGPWDFTRPVVTRGLWIAEGFTNYYETLSMRRAGVIDDKRLLGNYSGTITGVENSPGSRLMSAEEASLLASYLDRGDSAQRTNLANTSVSYYPKGEVLGLVLDLLIRGRSQGRASLDDVMRRMYREFYLESPKDSYYLKGRAYTPAEFERAVSDAAGADMSWFFERHVRAAGPPPYEEAFAAVGLRLARAPAKRPHTAGIGIDYGALPLLRVGSIANGSAAERAGLRQGDQLVSVGDKTDVTIANWQEALGAYKTGDRVPVTVRRSRQTVSTTLTLGEPDVYEYRIEEAPNATSEARTRRDAWLNGSGPWQPAPPRPLWRKSN